MSDKNASCSTFNEDQYFNFTSSNLGDLVNTVGFVDKTILINEIFRKSPMIMITAPRCFGKSTNMNMIKVFVEIQVDDNGVVIEKKDSSNYQIFKDNTLLIYQDADFFDKHFATYPVIHTSFKDVGGNSFEEVLNCFRRVLTDTYATHKYLLKSKIWSESDLDIDTFKKYCDSEQSKAVDVLEIKNGLLFLSRCLFCHFDNKKVFLLIDDYDAPINNALCEKEVNIKDINRLFADICSITLKENEFAERALLTGISYYEAVGGDNIEKYIFLGAHPFVEYYGLIETEIDALFSKFEINDKEAKDVKSYYNGYNSKWNDTVYSLWSVLHYLQTKELLSYWETSDIVCRVWNEALRVPLIQFIIEKSLQGDCPREIKIFETISLDDMVDLHKIVSGRADIHICNLFLSFLLQQGYLTYNYQSYRSTPINCVVAIPNNAIRDEFTKQLHIYYGKCTNEVFEECTTAFDQISVSRTSSFQEFVGKFQAVVDATSRDIIEQNEYIFHALLLCVIFRSQFQVCNDGKFLSIGRSNLIVKLGKNGFLIQIRFRQDSKKALQQIIESKYIKLDKIRNLEHKLYLAVSVSEDLYVSLAVLINTLDINKAEYFPH